MDYSTRIEEAEKRQRPGEVVELKKKKAEWPVGHSRNLPNWETENGDSRSLSCYAGARRDGLWSSFAGDHPIAVGEKRQGEGKYVCCHVFSLVSTLFISSLNFSNPA